MSIILITFLGNFIVGGFIGICGIAGFLLPMMYAGLLGFPVSQSLALSFLAFFVSGAIGSYNYHKRGNLDVRFSIIISVGSFFGGLLGVKLNALITPVQAKLLLYLVVLLSGISILCRKDKPAGDSGAEKGKEKKGLLDSPVFVIAFGFITGAVCSLSGAGGPSSGYAPAGSPWNAGSHVHRRRSVRFRLHRPSCLRRIYDAVRSFTDGPFISRHCGGSRSRSCHRQLQCP